MNQPHKNTNLRQRLAQAMWLFWGLLFCPLKWLGVVKLCADHKQLQQLQKPFIIVSNHRHPLDPLILLIAFFPTLTRQLLPITHYVAALHRLQRPIQKIAKAMGLIQFVYYIFNVVIIPEQKTFAQKVAPLSAALAAGNSVIIFPEGRANNEDFPRLFKNGVAALHRNTDISIIPCGINYCRKGFFVRAVVSIGTPLTIPSKSDQPVEQVAELIRQAVTQECRKAKVCV